MDRNEPIILVTGATDGIGKGTARALAEQGARVLLHGRNPEKLDAARAEIAAASGSDRLETYVADFAENDEVRRLAGQIGTAHEHLTVLINNAGIGTVDGDQEGRAVNSANVELRFQVNHLAPFLLNHLLLPQLKRGAPARIVNVSSSAQRPLDFDNVMLERDYSGYRAYAQSKLAILMATIEMAGQLNPEEVTVNALHPGSLLDTKMVREGFGAPQGAVDEGIEAELFLATAPELQGVTGRYYDQTRPGNLHSQAEDPEARRRLWQLSLQLTGLG